MPSDFPSDALIIANNIQKVKEILTIQKVIIWIDDVLGKNIKVIEVIIIAKIPVIPAVSNLLNWIS